MAPQDESGFIEAVRKEPQDNGVRLVYADWLEDHGQPERAELIRVQVALAEAPEDLAEYRALRAREAAVLDGHGKEWFAPLKKLGVRAWALRRGLVEGVALPARKFLEQGEQLLAIAPVGVVKLTAARGCMRALGSSPLLARLSGLDLSGNQLRAGAVRALLSPHVAGLRSLDLSDNPLGPGGVQALTGSPHLAGLRRLTLRGVAMGCEGAQALAGHIDWPREYAPSVNLTGLTALDIRDNEIYEEGAAVIAHSPHLAGLTELSLSSIGGKSAEELQESRYLRNLTALRISGDFSEGIGLLLCCEFVKQLRVLDLSKTGAEDEHAEEIATCRHLTELEHLHLAGNFFISDDGVQALASRAHMPRLRWLDLHSNQVGSAGVRALCGSPLARELRELDLSSNRLDDDAAEALASSPNLSRLCGLLLYDNSITDAGALALARSPLLRQLEALNLDNNLIDKEGERALHQAAQQAGLPYLGGKEYAFEPQRSHREPFREVE